MADVQPPLIHARLVLDPLLMKYVLVGVLTGASLFAGQGQQTFTGTITDSECSGGDHSRMQMGANNAECTLACIDAHGATYVLYDGKNAYKLSDQQKPEAFAGHKVVVVGTLDAQHLTIQVQSITAAE